MILLKINQENIFQEIWIKNYYEIFNLENFIATSIISNENNCYTDIWYSSYEFRILIDIINCLDNYGFCFFIFDASLNEYYS